MRTVIAPLHREVEQQLLALDRKRGEIARLYIRRLALEPYKGHGLTRGVFVSAQCRAVYFDLGSRPKDLFGEVRELRRGNQDLSEGPRYRVVYRLLEARRSEIRVVQVLGVGRAHAQPGELDVYVAAAGLLGRLVRNEGRMK
ncbi:MAG: hypothetical protein ACR2LV_05035 [Solirubrobacteraceae bacterium]